MDLFGASCVVHPDPFDIPQQIFGQAGLGKTRWQKHDFVNP
jgi:hypothetical protein